MKTIITKMSIIGLIVLMMASCRKDPAMPGGEFVNIKTNEITEITGFSAVVSAYVGADCDERGVCWSTSPDPTVSDWHTTDGSGTGSFTSSITGLVTNKTYYVRAYATNSKGTSYGEQKSFTTNYVNGHEYVDLGLPSGLLWATCNVGADSPDDYGWYFMWGSVTEGGDPDCSWANCPGNGGSSDYNSSAIATWDNSNLTNNVLKPDVDAASVSWGGDWRMPTNTEWQELINHTNCTWTTENGVYGRKFEGDNGNYVFLPAAGLRDGTILVYAGPCAFYWSSSLNSSDPIFACNVYFVSGIELYPKYRNGYRYFGFSVRPVCAGQSISAPAVTTSSVSNITQTTATCGGNVTSDGGANVTARGICWSTSQNPTVSDSHTTDGSGTGSFTSNITGLTENTTYYVRAYATNSKGTSYGEQKSFTTSQSISVLAVTTASVSNITQTTATCGGSVTSDGGAAVTARGVCWSTSQNPTVSNSHTTDGSGIGSFTSSITGLTASTTYYVRAYATNSKGTSYGEQKSFTSNFVNGHAYVDFGLPSGLLWATCNVGAEHPYDYGWYFMWGSVTEGGDPDCSWANCPGNGGSSDYNATAFSTWKAANLTNDVLNSGVDAATANWGGGWRMPTTGEWKELYGNTTCTWTTENGVDGRKFTSKADSSKYIFLPAAGCRNGTDVYDAGSIGYYWSSSLYSSSPGFAYFMYFFSGNVYPQNYNSRYGGFSVRPVR